MSQIIHKIKQLPVSFHIIFLISVGLILYSPCLNGRPVWDDWHFIFGFSPISQEYNLWKIWTEFNWPLSVSIQKFLYHIFGEYFLGYHIINFSIHLFNTYLIYNLAQHFKITFSKLISCLFFIHPVCVITVGWMVQLKTLLCFGFSALSFTFLLKGINKRNILISSILLILSLLSKSASLPLIPVYLYLVVKDKPKKIKIISTILGVIFISIVALRLLKSPVTQQGVAQLTSQSYIALSESIKINQDAQKPSITQTNESILDLIKFKCAYVVSSINYYFWQVVLPLNTAPIKGPFRYNNDVFAWLSLAFIIIVIFLIKNSFMLIVLGLGFLLLSPFLGLFFAPFMNMTWVSDQHLYLALPFFITFWISIWEKWNVRLKTVFLSLIFLLFVFKTFFTAKYFRDDISFYSESLKADFTNLPVVYNLIKAHLELGQIKEAIHLSNEYILMAPNDPKIGGSKYFPKIYELHQELKKLNKP